MITGRNLTITAINLTATNPVSGDGRVKVNVVKAMVGFNATLRLIGLNLVNEADGELVSTGDVPLLEIREGGIGELIQSELRVLAGESAIKSLSGAVMLRQTTISGVVRSDVDGSCPATDTSTDLPLVHMDASRFVLDVGGILEFSDAAVPNASGRLLAESNTLPVARSLQVVRRTYRSLEISDSLCDRTAVCERE